MKTMKGILTIILTTVAVGAYAQQDSSGRPMPRGTNTLTPTTLPKSPPPTPSTPFTPTNPQIPSTAPSSPFTPTPYIPVTPPTPPPATIPPPHGDKLLSK